MARIALSISTIVVLLLIVAFGIGLLRVDQTQRDEFPRLEISGGQAPKFAIETAKVNVTTADKTIEVPKVVTEKRTVALPTVAVDKPGQ